MSNRIALVTLWGLALLSGSVAGSGSDPAAVTAEGPRPCVQPPAYLTTHLEVDWLEDGVGPVAAWNINRGVLPGSGEARFRVYGASDDPRFYCNVTPDFKFGSKWQQLRVRVHGRTRRLGKSSELYYDAAQNAVVYRPRADTSFGRAGTEILEFIWTARPPKVSYRTRFTLELPRRP